MKLLVPVVKFRFKKIEIRLPKFRLFRFRRRIFSPGRRKLVWLLIVAILIFGVWQVIKNIESPVTGTISQAPPSYDATDPYSQPGKYDGKYVSFSYPAHYQKPYTQPNGHYIETVIIRGSDNKSKQIAFSVADEKLSDESGYVYRTQHPELYKTRAALGTTVFETTNGLEETIYLQKAGRVAVISATSNDISGLLPDLEVVANSLQWK